jgi:hypothetical protein
MSAERAPISADRYVGGLLLFFYQTVRRHLVLVILLPVAAAVLAFAIARQLPPAYGAQASIRLGRIDGGELMSPQGAVTWIISSTFKQRVVQAMNLPVGGSDRAAQLIAGSLTARPETADTVAVTVRAPTVQQVRQALDVAVQLLNEEQDRIRQSVMADINEQLANIDANIVSLSEIRDSLSAAAKAIPAEVQSTDPASGRLRTVWLLDLVSRNQQMLTSAKVERRAVEARLRSWKTYPTTLRDGAFLSANVVSASPARIAIVAGLAMLLACILYALIREPRRSNQKPAGTN